MNENEEAVNAEKITQEALMASAWDKGYRKGHDDAFFDRDAQEEANTILANPFRRDGFTQRGERPALVGGIRERLIYFSNSAACPFWAERIISRFTIRTRA